MALPAVPLPVEVATKVAGAGWEVEAAGCCGQGDLKNETFGGPGWHSRQSPCRSRSPPLACAARTWTWPRSEWPGGE